VNWAETGVDAPGQAIQDVEQVGDEFGRHDESPLRVVE
jgi:hypothetical protein